MLRAVRHWNVLPRLVDAAYLKVLKAGWVFRQPDLIVHVLAHGRGIGTMQSLRSFYESMITFVQKGSKLICR